MVYTNNNLNQISFPLGGIGTGAIGLAGNGALVDWEIYNRPNKGSHNPYSFFAIKAEFPDGSSDVRVLQGDLKTDLTGKYNGDAYSYGVGPRNSTMCGFPHFRDVRFDGSFPIAKVTFEDDTFPATVTMTAFNPMIPLDADDSSIPAAFFEITVESRQDGVIFSPVFSVCNPFGATVNQYVCGFGYTGITMFSREKDPASTDYGDLTVAVDRQDGFYQEYWYRGRWQDPITTFWHEFSKGSLENRHYDTPGRRDICSVGASAALNYGGCGSFRFVLSWNVPNQYNYWSPYKDASDKDITWKNYYAVLFADSTASCRYALSNWDDLYSRTNRFCTSLHSATLDPAVIDAISSTLSVLKSPTVLRLEDGSFYGWEGSFETKGSCEGTCSHVWSYVYALCFLYPELERSLRDVEFRYDTTPDGWMYFRTVLPLGREHTQTPPCVDGQMATVIKIYRDWKITGDSGWLKDNWESITKILEFAWSEQNPFAWDRNRDGVLEGMQHHTLDMELFGPSSWLEGMYLAALKAASEMAEFLGFVEQSEEYWQLFQNGYQWTKKNLFNGSYFFHKVDLEDQSYTARFNCPDYWNEEKKQLKYQIGEGCEIDQLLGQWHATLCGLGDVFDKEQRKTALMSMFCNNFKPAMRNYTNMWRVFALNDESGTIMCDYPVGVQRPVIPIPYCDECMTGFEYALAGLLISEGFIEEGLRVVRAVRNRYDGEKRNPWNEIEYGSNYARAMSSFALLPIFSGFTFHLPKKQIGFAPLLPAPFRCFWSLGTGWGDFIRTEENCQILLASGYLEIGSITLGNVSTVKTLWIDGQKIPFSQDADTVSFPVTKANREIRLEVTP